MAGVEQFVYYRAAAAHAGEVQRLVTSFQRALCAAHPGLHARLLRRPPAVDSDAGAPHTWMECYRVFEAAGPGDRPAQGQSAEPSAHGPHAAAAGVDDVLAAEIEAAARVLAPLIDGTRHVEAFVPCA